MKLFTSLAVSSSFFLLALGGHSANAQTAVTSSATSTQASSDGTSLSYSIPYASAPTWVRVFIDSDKNLGTGYVQDGIGANYLIENGQLYRYSGTNGSWAWAWIKTVSFTKGATSAQVKVSWPDLGSPPAVDTITRTDPPLKISSKLTTTLTATSPTTSNSTTTTTTPTTTTPTTTTTPSTTSTTPPTTTTAPVTETIRIDYFGDSTVWGGIGGTSNQVAQTPPMVLDAGLPVNYVVKNEGVGGASIAELLSGADGIHPVWTTTVAQSTAKYIIMNYGINDSYERNTTTTSYMANYAKAIDIARAAGKIVILETPNPTHDGTLTQNFADALKQVAAQKNVPVIDQYYYLKQYMTTNNLGIYQVTNDGVHPTQATYLLKGQFAAKRFKEIVGIQ
jgi:lysophospholipase L1-like esterase